MSKKEQLYIVDGFAFRTEKEAEQAKKEREGIRYIKEKVNMEKPEEVLQIYNKIIHEKIFSTAVGQAYLLDMREFLRTNLYIKDEDILPIEVVHPSLEDGLREEKQKYQEKLYEIKKKNKKKSIPESAMQQRYKVSLMINLILAVSIACMFFISATSGHPTVLNYEKELLNRYSAWEQELTEREAALREAERNGK